MAEDAAESLDRYSRIIETIFLEHYREGADNIAFGREELSETARQLGIEAPRNLGDIVYSFRYRRDLPDAIRSRSPDGMTWVIKSAGRSRYMFTLARTRDLAPSTLMSETKIPDCTPGIIAKYAFDDEQALLARVRYNRLIDIFSGIVCYSLQNHLRTTVPGIGQVETDEIYVGVDRKGSHYVIPVQAKGRRERLGVVQIEQDFALCADRFPSLVCIPVAALFMHEDVIALFSFEMTSDGATVLSEKHYRLVPPEEVSLDDLRAYRQRPDD